MKRLLALAVVSACLSAGCATSAPPEKLSLVSEVFRTPSHSLDCTASEVPYCHTNATRVVSKQEESCRCMNPFALTRGHRWR
jgi:hypothetical protein